MAESHKAFFEPVLWKDYLGQYLAEEANQYRTTARYVSVQTLADLDPVLKRSNMCNPWSRLVRGRLY